MTTISRHHRASAQRRRAALLDATRELIGEIGAGAITHRAVARRAEVPLSTTSYFFGSIDELVTEALREQRHDQIRSFDEAERTWILHDDEPTTDLLQRIAGQLTDRNNTQKAANVESFLAAGRNPELTESIESVLTRFQERIRALTRNPDSDEAEGFAWAVLALALGDTLHQVAELTTEPDRLAHGFELLLAGALLSPEERADLLASLDERRRSRN